jgi:cytochrome c-type biogenesis protein CcmE
VQNLLQLFGSSIVLQRVETSEAVAIFAKISVTLRPQQAMKKIHIVLLVFIAGAIAVLLSFLNGTSTYDTIDTAMSKPGKFVHLMASLDHNKPIDYDAIKNPNYLSFTAIDTTGKSIRVVYHNAKPDNLEISEKLVLKGRY